MKPLVAALILMVLRAPAAYAQPEALVRGTVTDAEGRPEPAVRVQGGGAQAVTGPDGRYLLRVAPGRVTLTATRVGMRTQSRTVRVAAGREARVDFVLLPYGLHDDLLLVRPDTALWRAGTRRDTIAPREAELAGARSIPEMLAARVPGLQVRPGSGAVAAGSRLRLRGASGVEMPGELLVVVDGVHVVSEPSDLLDGDQGQRPSRLDDFAPGDVERVEVLPASVAIARYGARGANGAVEIHTRRGSSGGPRIHGFAEAGVRTDRAEYPANYGRVGRLANGARTTTCTLTAEAAGQCTPVGDSILAFNPLQAAPPFRTGGTRRVGASVSGGFGTLVLLAGGTAERDLGVLRRDARERGTARGAFTLGPVAGVELSGSVLHLRSTLELPRGDEHLYGSVPSGLTGTPFDDPERRGYSRLTQAERDTLGVTQEVSRTVASASLRWSPAAWLSLGARYGMDGVETDEVPHEFLPGPRDGAYRRTLARERTRRNADAFARAEYPAPGGLRLSTELGAERLSGRLHALDETVTGQGFSRTEWKSRERATALYLRQGLSWRDRLHAFAAVHREATPNWPDKLVSGALSAAWDLAGERFFWTGAGERVARFSWVRLRASYGRAEQAPLLDVRVVPACPDIACGQARLEPQLHAELEGGVDAGLLRGWTELALTGYRRRTDQVLSTLLTFEGPRTASGGRVVNLGAEARVRVGTPRAAPTRWELVAVGAVNRNRLEDFGSRTILFGRTGQVAREGLPVGGFYTRRITGFHDRDGDGVISGGCTAADPSLCEVQLSAEPEYRGSPDPTRMLSLFGRIRLRGVELSALLDHQGGMHRANLTQALRCAGYMALCRSSYDPATPLAEQARVAALQLGYVPVEDASFTRLREAAVTVAVPEPWARRLGGRAAAFTVTGRNLATWTPFNGMDPETNFAGQAPFVFGESFTQALPRTLTTRLDVTF